MQAAFDTFYLENYRVLAAFAFSRGGISWPEAEEVTAAAMLDVDKRWETIGHPLAYARKAVKSHIAALFRDSTRGLEVLLQEDEGEVDELVGVDDSGLALVELKEWLLSRWDVLTPAMGQVIRGLVFGGMTVDEMSKNFRKNEAAIRKQLSLARARLHEAWLLDHDSVGLEERREGRG
ncbi:RNA polymerase sigma factor [Rhizocola hellebori]|uniref:RNA polymerase sigma factor n=1 Tax=Rhizocola hellebori TaxID=1392758 RepID=UPI001945AE31|nr:sigma-70 family RNA polymerase sigma factor [Rhizocola hellebori]